MTEPLRFVPPRVSLVDPKTGMVSREWYLFFQGVFNRVGGASGESTTDIVASLFEDAGSSETNAMVFGLEQVVGQYSVPTLVDAPQDISPAAQQLTQIDNITAELSTLQDRMTELVKELDSIKQGTLI